MTPYSHSYVKKKQFGSYSYSDKKKKKRFSDKCAFILLQVFLQNSLRCFSAQYCCIFLPLDCIFICPIGESKYSTTHNKISNKILNYAYCNNPQQHTTLYRAGLNMASALHYTSNPRNEQKMHSEKEFNMPLQKKNSVKGHDAQILRVLLKNQCVQMASSCLSDELLYCLILYT